MRRLMAATALCLTLTAPSIAKATPARRPAKEAADAPIRKSSLSSFIVRRIRHGVAVLENGRQELVLARVGTRLGDQNDVLTSIEQDRLLLMGSRKVGGKRLQSYVVLAWDREGRIRERRIETAPPRGAAAPLAGGAR